MWAQTGTFDTGEWSVTVDTLRGVSAGRRVTLSQAFIIQGSEVVTVAGTRLAPGEYVINYHMGTIRVDVPVPAETPVVVSYRRQPVLLDPVYSLRPVEMSEDDSRAPPARAPVVPERPTADDHGRNLVFGGTKSVSFSVGSNQGSQLDQTLQATIEGEVTPTIRVRALLSDNNLPIQPAGNTEELEYFDKVFVEIEGPRARATLGDFGYDSELSTFSPINRQLRGASGAVWRQEGGRLRAVGAENKGDYRFTQFRGVTGLQGPYPLLPQGRLNAEVIIAGTERVYLNGVEMRRGNNNDYRIDYDAGTLTFTPRRLITRDSEIAVDYQVTAESYEQSAVFASAEEVPLPNGFGMHLLFAQEGDDSQRPLNTTLSPEDISVLAEAGDDPLAAVTGGVTRVDPGDGQYILVPPDSLLGTPGYYAFNDSIGDYLVEFFDAGPRNGDYVLAGISNRGQRYFRYVGEDSSGSYRVGRVLPLPSRDQLLTARLFRMDDSRLVMDAEWNTTLHDRNLFSTKDDVDNVGHAGRFKLGFKDLPAGAGVVNLIGDVSMLDGRFDSFGRSRPQYFYRDWNLENVPLVGRELVSTGELSFVRAGAGQARYTVGSLNRDDFDSIKHEGNLAIGELADRGVAARAFDSSARGIRQDRTRRHLTAQASMGLWKVVPSVTWASERYREYAEVRPDTGQAYELVRVALSRRRPQGLFGRIEAERRETDQVDAATEEWYHRRSDVTLSAVAAARTWQSLQGELQVTHREEDDVLLGLTTSDLARLKATIRSRGTGIRSDVNYEVSQAAARTLTRNVILVGEGNGDYNAQGDLVGKGLGAYTLLFSPTTGTTPVNTVSLNTRIVWRPQDVAGSRQASGIMGWVRRNLSLDWTIGVNEETTHDPAWEVFLLVPSALQNNGVTVFGNTTIRQDWAFLEGVRNVQLKLRYLREDTEDNRFEGISEDRFFEQAVLRFSRSLSQRITLTAEGARSLNRRGGEGVPEGTGSRYDVTEFWALGGIGLRFSAGSTLDLDVKGTVKEDDLSGAGQAVVTVAPRAVWRIAEKVNLFGNYDYSQTFDRVAVPVAPVIFQDEGNSHRWSLTANIRLARVISLICNYTGRNETTFTGARITDHRARLETRALF